MEVTGVEDGLRMLRATIRSLELSLRAPGSAARFPKLTEAATKLDTPQRSRAPVGIEEYARQWHDYLDGKREAPALRAVKALCWHPEVATDKAFQDYLDHDHISLTSRALEGMVHSCHARWSPGFATGEVIRRVRARLAGYSGPGRLMGRWKAAEEMLLGKAGPSLFAAEILKDPQPVREFCERWSLYEDCPYVQAGVARAAEICRKEMDRVPGCRDYLVSDLLAWQHWPPDRFKEEVSKTVLHPAAEYQDVQACLRKFVVGKQTLGDPRLPNNHANWAGIRDAEHAVIKWFSQFDILFFFDHVLPNGSDPHGRKEFWLRYVSKVRRSRTLLSWADRSRLGQSVSREALRATTFGKMADFESTSSFLLDFGKVVVVEFSAVNNACYIYPDQDFKQIMPHFWTPRGLKASDLKNKDISLTRQRAAIWNGVHRPGWPGDATQLLAAYGIRP